MLLAGLWTVIFPDGGLLPVGVPLMLPTDLPAKQARLVLPLVWGTSQYQSILLPDTAAGQIKSGIMERLPEDQSFGIRMEHIGRPSPTR